MKFGREFGINSVCEIRIIYSEIVSRQTWAVWNFFDVHSRVNSIGLHDRVELCTHCGRVMPISVVLSTDDDFRRSYVYTLVILVKKNWKNGSRK